MALFLSVPQHIMFLSLLSIPGNYSRSKRLYFKEEEKENQYKLNKAMAIALANFACKILHRIFFSSDITKVIYL